MNVGAQREARTGTADWTGDDGGSSPNSARSLNLTGLKLVHVNAQTGEQERFANGQWSCAVTRGWCSAQVHAGW